MKHVILLAFLIGGCAHDVAIKDVQNGIVRSEVNGSIGVFDSEIEIQSTDPLMETCKARIGKMPGSETEQLCIDQTRRDVRRRNVTLDWYGTPYWIR